MLERHLLEAEIIAGHRGSCQRLLPAQRMCRGSGVIVRRDVPHVDDLLERGHLAENRTHFMPTIEGLAPVQITVDAESDLGGELPKPVDDTAGSEIRPATGPDGAHAYGSQHG